MTLFAMGWSDLAAFATLAVTMSGALYLGLRSRLAGDFVTVQQNRATLGRLDAIERRLQSMPSQDDFRDLTMRMGDVASAVASVTATVAGVRDSIARTERQVNMLLEAQLLREKG